ncbi:BclA C-terminal domain-containing protein [Paenibacillus sp. NPDC055715]
MTPIKQSCITVWPSYTILLIPALYITSNISHSLNRDEEDRCLITVLLGGTNVFFSGPPQTLSGGITINGTNDVVTLASAGTYYIAYELNTTVGLLLISRLLINGVQAPGSVLSPVITLSSYNNTVIVNVAAATTGASLTIIRLN